MDVIHWNLIVGWCSMAVGAVSGAWIGLSFAEDGWLGGYGSLRRRLLRLGHIACFGLGFVNVLFALSAQAIHMSPLPLHVASAGFTGAALTMAPCCFLAAWRPVFQRFFPVPVISALVALAALVGDLVT